MADPENKLAFGTLAPEFELALELNGARTRAGSAYEERLLSELQATT